MSLAQGTEKDTEDTLGGGAVDIGASGLRENFSALAETRATMKKELRSALAEASAMTKEVDQSLKGTYSSFELSGVRVCKQATTATVALRSAFKSRFKSLGGDELMPFKTLPDSFRFRHTQSPPNSGPPQRVPYDLVLCQTRSVSRQS